MINRKKPEGSKKYWTVINWILITEVSLIKKLHLFFTDVSLKDNKTSLTFSLNALGNLKMSSAMFLKTARGHTSSRYTLKWKQQFYGYEEVGKFSLIQSSSIYRNKYLSNCCGSKSY